MPFASPVFSRLELKLGLCLIAGLACIVLAGVSMFLGQAKPFLVLWGSGLVIWIGTGMVWQKKTGVSLYSLEVNPLNEAAVESRLQEEAMAREFPEASPKDPSRPPQERL